MLKKLMQKNDEFIAKKKEEDKIALTTPEGQSKIKAQLEKFGLNIDDYSADELQSRNAQDTQKIAKNLTGNKLIEAGMGLSFAKAEEQAKVSYLGALVDQNWILIRQNEVIIRTLTKLSTNR